MTDNKTLILAQFEKLKGQFVVNASWDIERLVAVGEDEMDYYWITFDGRRFKWNTCVGRLVPLKGYLREEDYHEFIRLARLNHFDQATLWGNSKPEEQMSFVESFKEKAETLEEGHRFLTQVCWDLV